MIRRATTGPLSWKAASVGLVWMGVSERWAGILLLLAVAVLVARKVRRGLREQYWEPEAQQYARHWTDLVWDNTRWDNGDETPHQAIERLAGPWKRRQRVPNRTG